MAFNLYQANSQWSNRPADQRFWTLEDAHQFCKGYADTATEYALDFGVEAIRALPDGNIGVTMDDGVGATTATFTHWGFGQLARMANAPAEYLRKLPAPLAAQCLEAGLDAHFAGRDEMTVQSLTHAGHTPVLRALTSDKYSRFWNHQVFERLVNLQGQGWRVPPARPTGQPNEQTRPATEADVLRFRGGTGGVAIEVGMPIAPAGIYASDHDMFAFLVNEEARLDDGSDGGLSRGFFIQNSEVGASALKLTLFHYRHVCGNHIVWDASDVVDIAIRHVGDVGGRFLIEVEDKLTAYLTASARADEERIRRARSLRLGAKPEEVLDAVFKAIAGGRRTGLPSGLNMKVLAAALDTAQQYADIDGDPFTVWGYVNGLTRLSQSNDYTDQRTFLDRTASSVLAIAV
jgi:hypothetical protein